MKSAALVRRSVKFFWGFWIKIVLVRPANPVKPESYEVRHVVAENFADGWTGPKLVIPFPCVEMTRPPTGRGAKRWLISI